MTCPLPWAAIKKKEEGTTAAKYNGLPNAIGSHK